MSENINDMVLRCAKTGKLFFSEKDAKQHNDDTGFAEFEQVSLDDKVWFCTETGKVCVTETEMHIYQKRDPTAKTFEEKTVGFLREQYLARRKPPQPAAGSGGGAGDPMEVDGEAGAPAAAAPVPNISKELLDQLLEMGFPQPRSEKALVRTSNAALEPAITWLAEHADDDDVDVPLEVTPNILPQADIDAAAAALRLTPEEKQAKLAAAVESAQRKREEIEKAEEKAREKARRESGKAMVKTKAELDELQRKRDMEARRKEKEDDARHRAFLRAELERDKAERRAKREAQGLPPLASDKPKPAPEPEPAAAAKPAADATPAKPRGPVELPVLPVPDAIEAICANRDFALDTYIETVTKLADNVHKNPAEPKYRHIRTSNPKIHERLIRPTAGELFLIAVGWRRDADGLTLPAEVAPGAFAEAVAQLAQIAGAKKEQRAAAEREKLKAEREAAMRAKQAEKERLRQQMEADRREISARGPAQTAKAAKLPTGNGGEHRLNLEEDPRDRQPGP